MKKILKKQACALKTFEGIKLPRFLLFLILTFVFSQQIQAYPDEKYQDQPSDPSKVYSDQKYQGPSDNPSPTPESPSDSWFNTGFDLSLSKLRVLLPDFIQVSPESQLIGDLKWDIEGFSQLNVRTDLTITGIRIIHRTLASHPVDIPDLSLRGTIRWDRAEKTLSFQDLNVGRRGVMARLSGLISYKNSTAVQLSLFLPETPIQQVLNAIPADLIPQIQGAQVQGTISMNTSFLADPERPQEAKLEPGIRINNYSLLQAPSRVNIPALKMEYVHEARKNGVIMRRILLSRSNPQYIPYDQLGDNLRQAILKSEDVGFFNHNGFNLEEIRKAMVQNLNRKGVVRGGSTITMQLAKNLFLDDQRTLSRKLQEAMLTYALERELTKEQILEIYANIIEWGVDVYGISEATQHYFSKPPALLTRQEASQLASIIPSPQRRDFNKRAPGLQPASINPEPSAFTKF